MKRSFCTISAAIALATATAASASADPIPISIISYQLATRAGVSVADSSGSDFDIETDQNDNPLSATAFASTALSTAVANATLTSQFENTLNWFGFGSAASIISTPGTGTFFADSALLVTFDVLAPLEYAFSGNFDGDVSPTGGIPPNRGLSNWASG